MAYKGLIWTVIVMERLMMWKIILSQPIIAAELGVFSQLSSELWVVNYFSAFANILGYQNTLKKCIRFHLCLRHFAAFWFLCGCKVHSNPYFKPQHSSLDFSEVELVLKRNVQTFEMYNG